MMIFQRKNMTSEEFDTCIKRVTAINETLSQRLTQAEANITSLELQLKTIKDRLQTENATQSRRKPEPVRFNR